MPGREESAVGDEKAGKLAEKEKPRRTPSMTEMKAIASSKQGQSSTG